MKSQFVPRLKRLKHLFVPVLKLLHKASVRSNFDTSVDFFSFQGENFLSFCKLEEETSETAVSSKAETSEADVRARTGTSEASVLNEDPKFASRWILL